jgi:FkbM family methyltransferase
MNKIYIPFSFLGRMESFLARLQGKGYGSTTIKKEVSCVLNLLKGEPNLAIDIGGNIGDYTAALRLRKPSLKIHVFEPSPNNIKRLNLRFNNDELSIIVPFALTDTDGTAILHSDEPGSGLGSLVNRKLDHFNISLEISESVPTIRFENYWTEILKSALIDIVKIDVEGYELIVLEGFGRALSHTKVIQFEFGGANIDTKNYFQDFWYFFKNNNFNLFRITPFGAQRIDFYSERDEYFLTTNYIAVNNAYLI